MTKPLDAADVQLRIYNLLQTHWCHSALRRGNTAFEEKERDRTKGFEEAFLPAKVSGVVLGNTLERSSVDPGHYCTDIGTSSRRSLVKCPYGTADFFQPWRFANVLAGPQPHSLALSCSAYEELRITIGI